MLMLLQLVQLHLVAIPLHLMNHQQKQGCHKVLINHQIMNIHLKQQDHNVIANLLCAMETRAISPINVDLVI